MNSNEFPILNFLKKFISDPNAENPSHLKYPTAISNTLQFSITEVGVQTATVRVNADPILHGNQQGTIHGGLICELADAAIGTAHSTTLGPGESFTTIEIKVNFIRPTWKTTLFAKAQPLYSGKTITHYKCDVYNDADKLVAVTTSTVMTLTGKKADGR